MQRKEYQSASQTENYIIFCSLPQYLPLIHPSGRPGRISSIFLQCLPCSRTYLHILRSSSKWKSSFLILGRRQLRNRSRICLGVNSIQWGMYLAFWNLLTSTFLQTCVRRPPPALPMRLTNSCPLCTWRYACSDCSTCSASFPRSEKAGLSIIAFKLRLIETASDLLLQTSGSSCDAKSQNASFSIFTLSLPNSTRLAPFNFWFPRQRASNLQRKSKGEQWGGESNCRLGMRVRGRRDWGRRGLRSYKSSLILLYA